MPEVHISQTGSELVERAAALVETAAADAIAKRGRFVVSLSGGSTPKRLYSRLADSDIDWAKAEIFIGDERNVPPDHEESNFGMVRETLLEPAGIDEARVHRWRTEFADPEIVAENFRKAIAELGEQPRFDLVLLGLGEDCHTASLFPGTAAVDETVRPAVANFVPPLEAFRYTITFPLINSAAMAVFLVSGGAKAEAVANVLAAKGPDPVLPATLVRPLMGRTVWLLDTAAARLAESS